MGAPGNIASQAVSAFGFGGDEFPTVRCSRSIAAMP